MQLLKCFIKHEARVLATGTNEEKLKLIKQKYDNILQRNLISQIMMKLKIL